MHAFKSNTFMNWTYKTLYDSFCFEVLLISTMALSIYRFPISLFGEFPLLVDFNIVEK